jgi:hypothetical protein
MTGLISLLAESEFAESLIIRMRLSIQRAPTTRRPKHALPDG